MASRPSRQPLVARLRERADVFLGFDPGLNQLLIAAGVMAGIAVTIGLVYVFVQLTHALWIEPPHGVRLPPTALAQLHLQHHAATLLAMLLGGLIGMLAAFTVAETDPRRLVLTMAIGPIPMLATMALATAFEGERTVGIALMAVVMGIGTWLPKLAPRIGARAFFLGQLLFVGYLFGFLSGGAIKSSQLGWIAAILWFAAAVNLALKLLVFAPLARGALRRTIWAFFARARWAIIAAAQLYETRPGSTAYRRARRRLDRRLTRLNEAALLIDGLLAEHAEIAHATHARLFDTELTVQNIGRLSEVLFDEELPVALQQAIAGCLADIRGEGSRLGPASLAALVAWSGSAAVKEIGALNAGRVARFATALVDWRLALARWDSELVPASPQSPFESPVTLMFGNLPGSFLVSSSAAALEGSRRARLRLDSFAQSGIRIAVAVSAAGAIGSVISERRFYWAVIAVFIAFMGANTTGEQVAKAANRVLGTVLGILLGSLLAHAVGASTWSVLVIVAALGFGVYFIRVSYALMVIGVTVMVSQLYVQLGEYSGSLLVLRLEETAIGAGVAALAALLVFPVPTLQAARVATREYFAQLGNLLDGLTARLSNGRTPTALTTAIRGLDHASQQLLTTARPLSRSPFRRDAVQHNLLLCTQASFHARNLAAGVQRGVELAPAARAAALAALGTQRELVSLLEVHLGHLASSNGSGTGTARLTDALRQAGDVIPVTAGHDGFGTDERVLLRHIVRLDETLAELGDNLSRRHAPAEPAA